MTTRIRSRTRCRIAARLAAAAVLSAAVRLPLRADADEESAAPPAPQRVSVQAGASVVKLQPDEIKRAGLEMSPPAPAAHQPSQPALGAVLDLQPLIESAAGFAAARSDALRTAAASAASQAAFERAQKLNAADQNVATRDLQAAEAVARGDRAAAEAATIVLEGRRAALEQQWGSRLAGWIADGAPEYQRLIKGELRLVRVTQPGSGHRARPPAAALVRRPDGRWVPAALVSPAGQSSPEFQTESWYFLAESGGGLLPGMIVETRLPADDAQPERGVVIPAAAVVWWQGRAWVYQETAAGTFTRREISTDQPDGAGGFFVAGFPADHPVVTTGAQVLLSEETRPAGAED